MTAKGKIPLVNSTLFIKEHAGSFHNIYKSLPFIRKNSIINSWFEKVVTEARKNWWKPESKFSSVKYFKSNGFNKIVHLTGHERRWKDRPELLESKGRLDCYGAFVAHYRYMTDGSFKDSPTVDDLAFSSNHFWNPNNPPMGSRQE